VKPPRHHLDLADLTPLERILFALIVLAIVGAVVSR